MLKWIIVKLKYQRDMHALVNYVMTLMGLVREEYVKNVLT